MCQGILLRGTHEDTPSPEFKNLPQCETWKFFSITSCVTHTISLAFSFWKITSRLLTRRCFISSIYQSQIITVINRRYNAKQIYTVIFDDTSTHNKIRTWIAVPTVVRATFNFTISQHTQKSSFQQFPHQSPLICTLWLFKFNKKKVAFVFRF